MLLGRKVMTNLDSILKSRDITLLTKVRLVKVMVFPVVMYGGESWTIKKAEHRRIDAFELWCWRRLFFIYLFIYFTLQYCIGFTVDQHASTTGVHWDDPEGWYPDSHSPNEEIDSERSSSFVGKVMSLLLNMLSRLVITFLPRSKCLFNFMAAVTICSDFGAP